MGEDATYLLIYLFFIQYLHLISLNVTVCIKSSMRSNRLELDYFIYVYGTSIIKSIIV